eukprot:TRINITY_DN14355_c0_g1_i1.p1 TRINITY_DN14355_c0_g1~~TRINITY_DN14355_c0_g1_i1.p1  ORF type:complete len:842 (+),score=256.61 TRINITY_DN14355_c0_g1_i1:60-2528(+)
MTESSDGAAPRPSPPPEQLLDLAVAFGKVSKQGRQPATERRGRTPPEDLRRTGSGLLPDIAVHRQVLELKRVFDEKEARWSQMLQKAEAQLAQCARKEGKTVSKYRQIIDRQQAVLVDRDSRLAKERQQSARLITSCDMLRNEKKRLQDKYDRLCVETKGSAEPPVDYDGGLSDAAAELLELREQNDALRVSLARHGVFDTVGRANLLGVGERMRTAVRSMRVELDRVRFQLSLLVGVIPGFLGAGGGFLEAMDEWLRVRGEEAAIADLTAHTATSAQTFGEMLKRMAKQLVSARGDNGRTWREDLQLRALALKGQSLVEGSRALIDRAAAVGALSRVGLPRNVGLLGVLRETIDDLLDFFPRFVVDFQEKQKPKVAFGRSHRDEGIPKVPRLPSADGPDAAGTPAVPTSPYLSEVDWSRMPTQTSEAPVISSLPSGSRAAKATAAELLRLREDNLRLERELRDTVERVNYAYRAGLDAGEVAAAATASGASPTGSPRGPVPFTPSLPATCAELPTVADAAPPDIVADIVAAAPDPPQQQPPRKPPSRRQSQARVAAHLTADARSFKATVHELFGAVSAELSPEERMRLQSLFDQAVSNSRKSAQSSFRALVDELNLKKMLSAARGVPGWFRARPKPETHADPESLGAARATGAASVLERALRSGFVRTSERLRERQGNLMRERQKLLRGAVRIATEAEVARSVQQTTLPVPQAVPPLLSPQSAATIEPSSCGPTSAREQPADDRSDATAPNPVDCDQQPVPTQQPATAPQPAPAERPAPAEQPALPRPPMHASGSCAGVSGKGAAEKCEAAVSAARARRRG